MKYHIVSINVCVFWIVLNWNYDRYANFVPIFNVPIAVSFSNCFKLFNTAWVNRLWIYHLLVFLSFLYNNCILFDWKVFEVIIQIVIIIIIIINVKKKKYCLWPNEKSFEVTEKKLFIQQHTKKKRNAMCLHVPHSKWFVSMRWKKADERGNFAKIKYCKLFERIIKL